MKAIKPEYANVTVFNGKIGRDIQTKDITPEQYDFYANNGLSFIFEEVCSTCKKGVCSCKSVLEESEDEVKEYIKPTKKK
jgi:hypothetical protein